MIPNLSLCPHTNHNNLFANQLHFVCIKLNSPYRKQIMTPDTDPLVAITVRLRASTIEALRRAKSDRHARSMADMTDLILRRALLDEPTGVDRLLKSAKLIQGVRK